jgi:hypothetical protein
MKPIVMGDTCKNGLFGLLAKINRKARFTASFLHSWTTLEQRNCSIKSNTRRVYMFARVANE